jgi:hypothetical protein
MNAAQAHVTIRLHCIDFPGRSFDGKSDIRVGPQKGDEVVDDVFGDAKQADFSFDLRVERNPKDAEAELPGALRARQAGRTVPIPLLGRA